MTPLTSAILARIPWAALRGNERKAKVVEQRFFAGIDMSQIAENLGVSLATVKRDWEYARTWLMREMQTGE